MILVRDIFQLKFGKAKDANEAWEKGKRINKQMSKIPFRILTDLTGKAYTFVFESTFESLSAYESTVKDIMSATEWKNWYATFVPLVESSYREIFTKVEESNN